MNKSYSFKEIIITGFALFALLFGAGNLIFPPLLGYELGNHWGMGALGFILTGVGLPFLAIVASKNAGGTIDDFSCKVSPIFKRIYSISVILALGPLMAIPRTGALSYELTFFNSASHDSHYIKYIYLFCYFFLAFLFSIKQNKIIDRVGKYLTPILLAMLGILLIKGSFFSNHTIASKIFELPFKKGFTEGYQTLDAMAAVVFAMVIIGEIQSLKNLTPKEENRFFLKSSIIAIGGLGLVYIGLTYVGATFDTTPLVKGVEDTDLLYKLSITLLGKMGNIILAICVAGACLSTAIGLLAIVGKYFSNLLHIPYEPIVILTTIIGFGFSIFGVDEIVKVSMPVLVFMYPITIVLTFLNLFRVNNTYIYKGTAVVSLLMGLYASLLSLHIHSPAFIENIYNAMPLNNLGLGWVVPTIVVGIICVFIKPKKS